MVDDLVLMFLRLLRADPLQPYRYWPLGGSGLARRIRGALGDTDVRTALDRLVDRGLVERRVTGRGRGYRLTVEPLVDAATGLPVAPLLSIEQGRVVTYYVVACPFCGERHSHGAEFGSRVAHCAGDAGERRENYTVQTADLFGHESKRLLSPEEWGKALATEVAARLGVPLDA